MNNSLKNLTIVGLLIVALVEGGYIIKNRNTNSAVITQRTTVSAEPEKAPAKTDLPMLKKGDKLADSAIAKMAYKIAPGDLSTDATKAITGFTMARVINTDGS
ncbi:MAG: hypothetical protein NT141_02715, partial [candidate division WWE3 bacterium]|nr:hypothetical protein [candidate division WWE3 bacterium]